MTTTVAENLLLTAPEVAIEAGGTKRQPKISIVAYSGGVMRVPGWGDVAIDLDGLDASGQVPLLAGDIDLDGDVDLRDASALLAGWGKGDAFWADGDFNQDGAVDADDAKLILDNWGAGLGSQIGPAPAELQALVPEPATLSLLVLGGLAIVRRRPSKKQARDNC